MTLPLWEYGRSETDPFSRFRLPVAVPYSTLSFVCGMERVVCAVERLNVYVVCDSALCVLLLWLVCCLLEYFYDEFVVASDWHVRYLISSGMLGFVTSLMRQRRCETSHAVLERLHVEPYRSWY